MEEYEVNILTCILLRFVPCLFSVRRSWNHVSRVRANMQLNTIVGASTIDCNLDRTIFVSFTALLLRMGLLGLRRRDQHFTPEVKSRAMSQTTFESLLYTVRDVGFPGYEEGEQLPDGRTAVGNGPLKYSRRFGDQLVQEWQEVFVPGTTLHNAGSRRDNG
jgi:hypothetical protein